MKKLIVFDLDGTLAPSKSSLDAEMASLLHDLLSVAKVAVISGGAWLQFEKQVLSDLPQDERLARLSILPTCGTQFFQYAGRWKRLYAEDFTADEKEKIISSLNKAVGTAGFPVEKTWGETIEDRGSQITYSALGQQAPLEEKIKWDSDFAKRKKIKAVLDTLIPEFSVRLGGATSIDVTKPGIDKAYGIKKLRDILGISLKEMIYVGDALFVGGNDYPAEQAGVISIPVRGPNETKRVIEAIDRESIWISYCQMTLDHRPFRTGTFNFHHRLASPVSAWERLKIGGGTPPILTAHGWLIIYHGVSEIEKPDSDSQVSDLQN